jgi:hypothetical protein
MKGVVNILFKRKIFSLIKIAVFISVALHAYPFPSFVIKCQLIYVYVYQYSTLLTVGLTLINSWRGQEEGLGKEKAVEISPGKSLRHICAWRIRPDLPV